MSLGGVFREKQEPQTGLPRGHPHTRSRSCSLASQRHREILPHPAENTKWGLQGTLQAAGRGGRSAGQGPDSASCPCSSCRTARLYPLHSYSQTVYCRPVCFPGLSRSQPSRPQLLPSPWAEMSPVGSIYQHQQVAVGKCHCPPGVLVRACPAALPEVDSGMVNAGSGRLAPLLITQPLRLSFPSVTW